MKKSAVRLAFVERVPDCRFVVSGTPPSATLAVSRHRSEPRDAEVIDLVHLPAGTRPTPIAYIDYEEVGRLRVMECEHYQQCLQFAAEVRWRSFHCRQCPKNPDRVGSGDDDGRAAAIIRLG